MKKAIPFVALIVAGICVVEAVYFCGFYYTRELQSRLNYFDHRLATLEAHKSRQLTPVHFWGVISTSDKPTEEHIRFYLSSEKQPDGFFEAVGAKGGPLVVPELRLPVGSTTNCTFNIKIGSQFGIVADAWLSHAAPYQDLAAFDDLRVYSARGTNHVTLVAQLKPGASVQMRFSILVLCEQ
jgi:hypothetical protein